MSAEKVTYQLSTETSHRINVLKIWLIVMVLFIHSNNPSSWTLVADQLPVWLVYVKRLFSVSVSECAVPGFFFLSSVFLYRKDFLWSENVRKKFRTIVVPYMLINCFWIVFFFLTQNAPQTKIYFSNDAHTIALWNLYKWVDGFLGVFSGSPLVYPLWFLRDLFLLNVFAKIIKRVLDAYPVTAFVVLLIIWLLLPVCGIYEFRFFNSLCFWCFGCIAVKKNILLEQADKYKMKILILFFACVFLDFGFRTDFWGETFHRVSIFVYFIFLFSWLTNFKSKKIKNVSAIISPYVFSIYIFHELTLSSCFKLAMRLLPSNYVFWTIEYFGIPCMVFVGCLVFSIMLKKTFPRLYAMITGNR